MSHFMTKCIECDKVISQCRCIDANKPVFWVICQTCKLAKGVKDELERANKVVRDGVPVLPDGFSKFPDK